MAEYTEEDNIETYVGAILAVFQALGKKVDLRKVFWANYPVLSLERDQLGALVRKDTRKLEKEFDDDLCQSKLWYVGVPGFRLVKRPIAHLTCEIDLYYVACDTTGGNASCWYGKIIAKADKFDVPLCLINPLIDALSRGQMETGDAHIVERTPGCSIYDFMGREWKIPDAFLGFVWAIRERGSGFEGLLDPLSCQLMGKFAKELPPPEVQKLGDNDYQAIVTCLKEQMGYPKAKAEEAAKYVMEKAPNEPLESKIREALKFLSA